jgi:tRNA A-37 threonylcarbamoyl transferase component Bud32
LATLAISPALGAAYVEAVVARRRFATSESARRALEQLGLDELLRGRTVTASAIGSGKSNAVIAVRLDGTASPSGVAAGAGRAPAVEGGGAPIQLVVKKALAFGTLMAWGARHFGANYIYSPTTTAHARIAREAAALRFLADHGVAVPRCLAADPERSLIAIEWIEGTHAATALHAAPSPTSDLAAQIGALFARVHALGVTLADGHPGNMLVRPTGELVLFDLEFAECADATAARRGFDLAYAAVLMPTAAQRDAMLAAYGARTDDDLAAFAVAERHLRKFGRLLDMERARWAASAR